MRCERLVHTALLLLALGLPAVAQSQTSIRDDRGSSLTFAAPPRRIVSLLPSLTESLCALGGCAT